MADAAANDTLTEAPLLPATVTPVADTNNVQELNTSQLTAPDGFIYDFKLSDVDYIQPLAALPHDNLTNLPAVPAEAAAAYSGSTPSDNPLMTWRLSILQHNKALWDASANRKVEDAVTTLIEQVGYQRSIVTLGGVPASLRSTYSRSILQQVFKQACIAWSADESCRFQDSRFCVVCGYGGAPAAFIVIMLHCAGSCM